MKILDVIPITRGIGKETLSYFSGKDVSLGSIVTVPVRKKGVPGIVVASHDLGKLKADIKDADFQLRNILSTHKNTLFTPEFIRSCVLLKNYYGTTTSNVIASSVPSFFLEKYLESTSSQALEITHRDGLLPEKFIFQAKLDERIAYYKTYVRQEFALKHSVFIMVPTIAEIERLHREVVKGIEERVFVLHSGLSKKQQGLVYEQIMNKEQSIVIIATAAYLFIPRKDITTIIVEAEGSSHYVQQKQPFLDKRDLAYVYAQTRGLKYIVADQFLRVSTLWHAKEEHYGEIKPLSFHVGKKESPRVLDMKKENDSEKKFEILSTTAIEEIQENIRNKKNTFLFVGRKGLAPITSCQDCGLIHRSPDSGLPLVLYQKKDAQGHKKSIYRCPLTHTTYDSISACQMCGSWKLKMLGVGTDTVKKELENLFPIEKISVIDGDKTPTHTSTKKALRDFLKKEGGILVATEKILPYLHESFGQVIIVSIDTLFSIPSFSIQERVMRLLLHLNYFSEKSILIQTRDKEQEVIKEFLKGNIVDFYRQEVRDRKKFHYPPFSILLEISVTATKTTLARKKNLLKNMFSEFTPYMLIEPSSRKGTVVIRLVMKIEREEWIKKTSSKQPGKSFQKLYPLLETLPQNYQIRVQ